MKIIKKVITRIAPSNTGFATIGNLRTAIYNYLFAKKHGGEFIIRIEDTDKKRFVKGAEEYMIKSLAWLGIMPDDGINSDGTAMYRQSEKDYSSYIEILLKNGNAYYAFDSEEELEEARKKSEGKGKTPFSYNSFNRIYMKNSISLSSEDVKNRLERGDSYTIRFNTPKNREISLSDLVCGKTVFNTKNIDDKVLWKSDGTPSYFLANTIDDIDSKISHVIKGVEWLSSYPTIFLLYEAFGAEIPQFAHLPLLLDENGAKLSKRNAKNYNFPICLLEYSDPETNEKILGFRELGYDSDALLNALCFLGWNPGTNQEIFSKEELINAFSLENVSKSGARVSSEKFKWFNTQYLRNRDNAYLYDAYIRRDEVKFINTWENHDKIVNIAKERSVFSSDLYKNVSYFFEPVVLADNVVLKNPTEFTFVMNNWFNSGDGLYGDGISIWSADEIKAKLDSLCELGGFKLGKILPDLRMALTGGIPGPHLPETMEILGPIESRIRIKALLGKAKGIVHLKV